MKYLVFVITICILAFAFYWHSPEEVTKTIEWDDTNSLIAVNDQCPLQPEVVIRPELRQALSESIKYFMALPDKTFSFGTNQFLSRDLAVAYQELLEFLASNPSTKTAVQHICSRFSFYRSAAESVRFTGYYEPMLEGSLVESPEHPYPIYALPDDLVRVSVKELPLTPVEKLPFDFPALRGRVLEQKLVPYFTRAEIDYENSLKNRELEIAWVSDPIDLFFLHIQGSGKVLLPDGSHLRVGYADKNGQPYRAIGKLLIDEGLVAREEMSMQAIKKYLRENPDQQERIFSYNPSYVFFRKLHGSGGPLGSIGRPLTAFHSIATDSSLFPRGALALVSLAMQADKQNAETESFLVLNQDTGGAIKTPGRVDVFLGSTKQGEELAGKLNTLGDLYFLAPNNHLK